MCNSGGDGCGGSCGGCCQGVRPVTPLSEENRPGLPALTYRAGRYGDFLATMRARLSGSELAALDGLRTRDPGDLSLALLEAWAAVGDVLTFYTERIANEGYLRTATERWSVVRLAALLGYTPRPGLSASTCLAYTVAAGPDVVVPAGSQAQSVPGPGELPATFETEDELIARPGDNALRLRRGRPPLLTTSTVVALTRLDLVGVQNALRAGQQLLITFADAPDALALYEITAVTTDPVAGRTRLSLLLRNESALAALLAPAGGQGGRLADRRPARLGLDGETRLGVLTDVLRRPPSVPPPSPRELPRAPSELFAGSSALLGQLVSTVVPQVATVLGSALAGSVVRSSSPATVVVLPLRAPLFGHQAPLYPTFIEGKVTGYVDPMVTPLPVEPADGGNGGGGGPVINLVAGPVAPISPPFYRPSTRLDLDAVHDSIRIGARIVLVNASLPEVVGIRTVDDVTTVTAHDLGLAGRITRITLDTAWPADQADLRTVLTGTSVLAAETAVGVADESIDALDVEGDELELDGVHVDLVPGRWVVVAGERVDPDLLAAQDSEVPATGGIGDGTGDPPLPRTGVPAAELSMIAAVEHRVVKVPSPDDPNDVIDLPGDSVHTFLRLAAPLAYTYLRPSVTVHGNVVPASHGQTRSEVLGAGDATRPHAEFPLKQPPLTYVPAPTAAGARSTLSVFVDGVAWQRVDDLIEAGPLDRSYLLRSDEAGATRVVFGDGVHGAIPPTGTENITATYRSGIGLGGNLGSGRITLLTTKPLGVTEVTNPIPATGGADPEGRDVIRENAPLSVQALDRLVSVADHQSFAQVFAGIGSSDAHALSDGARQVVHVTVAGIADAPIDPSSDLVRNLTAALVELGDPALAVQVAVRRLRLLVISARVRIDPDRRWSDVEPALRSALIEAFGPARARIGRPLAQAAVLAVMQGVPGVRYADLDVLDALDEGDLVSIDPAAGLGLRSIVPAALARRDPDATPGPGAILPGDLLRIDPGVPDTVILTELTGP